MSTPRRPSPLETRLAQERKARLEARLEKKRLRTFLVGAALVGAAAMLTAFAQPGTAFLLVLSGIIAFIA